MENADNKIEIDNKNVLYLSIIIIIIIAIIIYKIIYTLNKKGIAKLTDIWCREVAETHNINNIYKLFCSDGNLIGTVSQIKRKGDDIKKYFEYFSNKPGLKIISKNYNISKVTSNVFINTAFIEWMWDGLTEPITARMTFIYRNRCIFQLHSSVLPDLNETLLKVSSLT